MELLVLDTVHGLDHGQVVVFRLILLDYRLDGSEVLLEGHVDVVQQGTLTGQE